MVKQEFTNKKYVEYNFALNKIDSIQLCDALKMDDIT